MRTDSFVSIAARLRRAATAFERVAELADVATIAAPKGLASSSSDGVSRPVEDLVIAREDGGVAAAVTATRRHAVQAVLHAERACRSANDAGHAFDQAQNRWQDTE